MICKDFVASNDVLLSPQNELRMKMCLITCSLKSQTRVTQSNHTLISWCIYMTDFFNQTVGHLNMEVYAD